MHEKNKNKSQKILTKPIQTYLIHVKLELLTDISCATCTFRGTRKIKINNMNLNMLGMEGSDSKSKFKVHQEMYY